MVVPAASDVANYEALKYAQKVDPHWKRVLRVLRKTKQITPSESYSFWIECFWMT